MKQQTLSEPQRQWIPEVFSVLSFRCTNCERCRCSKAGPGLQTLHQTTQAFRDFLVQTWSKPRGPCSPSSPLTAMVSHLQQPNLFVPPTCGFMLLNPSDLHPSESGSAGCSALLLSEKRIRCIVSIWKPKTNSTQTETLSGLEGLVQHFLSICPFFYLQE